MGTFVVRDTPSQLYLGEQPLVTIINEGPYTVYLDSNASVTKDSGFPLPPTGQMTWRKEVELWAVTRGPGYTSTVKSNPSGELSLTTRAKFVNQIYNARITTSTWDTPVLETGHCNTLIINRATPGSAGNPTTEAVRLTWYNDNQEVLFIEDYSPSVCATWFGDVGPGRNWKGVIPVKGKFVQINLSGTGDTTGFIRIDGTDIILPSRIDGGAYFDGGGGHGNITYTGRTLKITPWDGVGALFLPSNGTVIHLAITNFGALSTMQLCNVLDGAVIESFSAAASAYNTYRFDVAVNVPLKLITAAGVPNGTLMFTWPNDPITC